MVLWFVSAPLLAMRWFFGDPAIDHRLIVAGALLPDVLHVATGGSPLLHSLALPVVGLVAVMLATVGRRRSRRRWLALPIGVFWHLVFDGAWVEPALFWWPVGGGDVGVALPLAQRPIWLIGIMELVGLIGCWWIWRSAGLAHNPAAQADFWKAGRLQPPTRPPRRSKGEGAC